MSIYLFKPPYDIGSVPGLSGHVIAYRCRPLPRVHRHRTSKPQGSTKRVLPWQVTTNQLICASLSHTHYYWYERAFIYLKRNLNASRPYEHPPVLREKMSIRLGGIIACKDKTSSWYLNGFPDGSNIGSSTRPIGVASQNSTLQWCAITTFPVSLPLSSPGDV